MYSSPASFFPVLTVSVVNIVILQKSISRVHLKIKVGEIPKGNGVGCKTHPKLNRC